MDLESNSAFLCGHDLHLNRAEFDVLLYLLRHNKRVVTPRTKLATRAEGSVSQTAFLPALLSLRKKLHQEAPGSHYIQAETWVLYDFHATNGKP